MQQSRRTGCWVCWKRKLKCDGSTVDQCANCVKRGVECQFNNPDDMRKSPGRIAPSRFLTEAGIPRERAQRACSSCASQKLKCSGQPDGCDRCLQNGLACHYPNAKRASRRISSQRRSRPSQRRTRQLTAAADPSGSDKHSTNGQRSEFVTASSNDDLFVERYSSVPVEISYTKDIVRKHIDAYFEEVYPRTIHGFLHQGTLLEEFDRGKAPGVLLKAIFVSSSPFVVSSVQAGERTKQWSSEVDECVTKTVGVFPVANLQIITLWATHHYSVSNLGKAWMLLSLAARLAFCLQIHVENKKGSPSQRECRRRIMWSIRILDMYLAGTVEEFALCSRHLNHVKLPCDEHFYRADVSVETDTLSGFRRHAEISNIGAFAGFVGLVDIWRDILLFMASLSHCTDLERIVHQVGALHQRLSGFENKLPPNLRFVNRNLYLHANAADQLTFIMLQSWWYECHCDLYRFSLPGFRESIDLTSEDASFMKHCQQQVLRFALAQSNFWRSLAKTRRSSITDPTVVVMVHSNTRNLLASQRLSHLRHFNFESPRIAGGTSEIPVLLASNVSLLDELSKRIPKVAQAQREIRKLIQTNGFQGSSEAVINEGLPLKRRHSREELRASSGGNETETNSESCLQRGGLLAHQIAFSNQRAVTFDPYESWNVVDEAPDETLRDEPPGEYGPTLPLHENHVNILDTVGLLGHQSDTMFSEDAPYSSLYEGDFVGGVLGYFTPFDIATNEDLFPAMDFSWDGEP